MTESQTYQTKATASRITAELLLRKPYDVAYTPDRLVAGFAFEIQTGLHAFASDRISPFVTPPSTLAFTPVGCDVLSKSSIGGEYLTIALAEQDVEHLFDQQNPCDHRYNNAAQKGAIALAETLRNKLLFEQEDTFGIEEAAIRFFEVSAFAADTDSQFQKPATSMTPRRWRLFQELVEADLSETPSIEIMAKALGLSGSFFIRAFKAATGSTPHAYIIRRRLNEARTKLTNRNASIAGVAAETGFASQTHMTSVFSKKLGITPRLYQQHYA